MRDAEILRFANLVWHNELTIDRNLIRIVRAALVYFDPNTTMNTDCHPVEQQAVQERLDSWYVRDGREDPEHPQHSLYTGLAEKYAQEAA